MVQIGEKDQGCKMINGVELQYPNAFGYCNSTPLIILQPWSFSPIWTIETPSFNKFIGAFLPFGYFWYPSR